jgi:chemotaxis protein methyltransferase CheR
MIERTSYDSPEYDVFKSNIKKLTGLDLNSYKNQIHRRVHMLMQRWSISNYDIFFKTMKENDQKLREFLDYLTINVSEFFRNPNKWTELQNNIIPKLIQSRGKKQLKLWSAGSATGEEPYSLAIVSLEARLAPQTPVLASDIDQGAIGIAKRGLYLKRQLINVPRELVAKYFTTSDGGETYAVNNEVKSRVSFQRLNLIEDSFSSDFDLILCRNVVIYFSADTKTALYHKFFKALRPGGYLLVGSTEQIFDYRKIGFESSGAFLYQKPV